MNGLFAVRSLTSLGCLTTLLACAAVPAASTLDASVTPSLASDSAAHTAQALLAAGPPPRLWLLGEQHDAPEHQVLQAELVRALAARSQLAALVLEMADAGADTRALAPQATEAQAQAALRWGPESGWPWPTYGPVVMAAVRAGVPVLGGNLPRAEMRAVMGDATLDARLPAPALAQQQRAIREGHCQLLPERQITPMTRIQIARDQRMAHTAVAATEGARAGQTVLLVAGNNHVDRHLGIPRHLPADLEHRVFMAVAREAIPPEAAPPAPQSQSSADTVWRSPPKAPRDYCAEMKRQMGR